MSDTEEAAPAAEDTIVLDEPIVECIAALSARSSDREAREPRTLFLARRVQLIDRTQVPAAAIGEVLEEEVVFRLGKTAIASAAEPRVIAQK